MMWRGAAILSRVVRKSVVHSCPRVARCSWVSTRFMSSEIVENGIEAEPEVVPQFGGPSEPEYGCGVDADVEPERVRVC